jgi:hypothetical protein
LKKDNKMGGTIMGKRVFILVFLVFLGICAFADTEEIDSLLFLPNSAEEFVDEGRATMQLDNAAKFILDKNPHPGQVYIYGYTANVENDIDSLNLSRARAQFVMNELRKRGIPQELFSPPLAYGGVDIWGNNANEEDRVPNRRVRIVLDGGIPTPPIPAPAEPEMKPVEPEIKITRADDSYAVVEHKKDRSGSKILWIILFLLLALALLAVLLSKLKKSNKAAQPAFPAEIPLSQLPSPLPPPAIGGMPLLRSEPVDASVTTSEMVVNLDEEIRFRAYELYLLRYGQNEDEVNDWYRAVTEVCGRYDASGYQTYKSEGSWWARKTMVLHKM